MLPAIMLKLRRLKIHEYRGVLPGVELRFSDGINILLGKNGTGKTTLLNLISMIVRSDLSELAHERAKIESTWRSRRARSAA